MVGLRRESLHVSAEILGTGNRAQLLFPLTLRAGGCRGVPKERLLVGDHMIAEGSERESCEQEKREHDAAIHDSSET